MVKPRIEKLGTIDCDMVETTPIVFGGRLYRFEYVRVRGRGADSVLVGHRRIMPTRIGPHANCRTKAQPVGSQWLVRQSGHDLEASYVAERRRSGCYTEQDNHCYAA